MKTPPTIHRAAVEIGYDSGAVHLYPTPEEYNADVQALLDKSTLDIQAVEAALAGLSDADLITLCIGEQDDQRAVLETMPADIRASVDQLLEQIFEEVCYNHE